ncbi:solute carrier family 2, facilitated glucose transporter member 5-like isoform X1 [Pantherophis guttatus]|uniref:Solute carrier family 2, facilitated glucose transporter member 5 n=2 Tax=Pantherophis guttatus TaxID=94885 RepID=A0A6P9CG52_PANGU|nr:solute carrier family 2, facilitated glucose transporter member 5-like isoform X1 [Pantherophis guttatus]
MDLDPEKAKQMSPRYLNQELTRPLMTMTIILTFGSSFQYGYNLWVVNHPASLIQEDYNITLKMKKKENQNTMNFLLTLTNVIYSLGGVTGSLMVCPMADTCGRKGTLVITNLLAFISAIFLGFSTIVHTYDYTIFSRLLSGICSGILSCAVPLYLAEIAPRNLRGGIMTMAMVAVASGVLFSQILGLHELLGSHKKWAILLSLTGILAVFQLFILPKFPESPRFLLIQRKNEEKARQVLRVLRAKEDVQEEIEELHQEDIAEMEEKELSVLNRLRYKGLRKQIIYVILLMAGQQFTGVNAVYYYTEYIYRTKWLNGYKSRYIIIVCSTFVLLTLLFVSYSVDSLGRRLLILLGFGICSTFCVLLTISQELQMTVSWLSYVTYIFLLIFLLGHVLGPGPLPNVIIAELFLQSSRSTGIMLGGFVHWLLNFITGVIVLQVENKIGSYSFLLFWPLCIASFVFIFRNIPETKQKSFLQIRNLLAARAIKKIKVRGSHHQSNPFKGLHGGRRKKPRAVTSHVPSVPSI